MNPLKIAVIFLIASEVLVGCFPILNKPTDRRQARNQSAHCPMVFPALNLCAEVTPDHAIQLHAGNYFTLKFWSRTDGSSQGPYVNPGFIPFIWLWMQMATGSHGSEPVVVSQGIDEAGDAVIGLYFVDNVVFTMPREWEIHLELRDPSGVRVHEAVQYIWI